METPNITQAQVASTVAAIAAMAATFGFGLSSAVQADVTHVTMVALPVAYLADAIIRHGRAGLAAASAAAQGSIAAAAVARDAQDGRGGADATEHPPAGIGA